MHSMSTTREADVRWLPCNYHTAHMDEVDVDCVVSNDNLLDAAGDLLTHSVNLLAQTHSPGLFFYVIQLSKH